MLIYSTLLSGGITNLEGANLGIINLDDGHYSDDLIRHIDEMQFDNTTKMFNLYKINDEAEGSELIKNEMISALLIIPSNYSKSIESGNLNSNIIVKGEPSSADYMLAVSSLNLMFIQYASELQENITGTPIRQINLITSELEGMDSFNMFDYLAPGLMVFAILINITSITSAISEETENGMLKRLKLTKMKSRDYIFGTTLSWIIIGSIEIILVLITAILCGYHWQGGLNSILLAIIVGILTIISSIAISLIITSITNSRSQATSLSVLVAFPLSLICGSFFPLPEFSIGSINGHQFQIYDLLPWSQTITIYREVLTFGNSLDSILPNILLIILSGVILLSISIILFKRKINNTN